MTKANYCCNYFTVTFYRVLSTLYIILTEYYLLYIQHAKENRTNNISNFLKYFPLLIIIIVVGSIWDDLMQDTIECLKIKRRRIFCGNCKSKDNNLYKFLNFFMSVSNSNKTKWNCGSITILNSERRTNDNIQSKLLIFILVQSVFNLAKNIWLWDLESTQLPKQSFRF